MLNYLQKWVDQLRWQRLPSFQKLAAMLLKHLEEILNYCRTHVTLRVVEAINGNIRMLINRAAAASRTCVTSYRKHNAWSSPTPNTSLFRRSGKPCRMPLVTNSCGEPIIVAVAKAFHQEC